MSLKVKDWSLVETSVDLHKEGKDEVAVIILEQGLDCSDCSNSTCCKSKKIDSPTTQTQSPTNELKNYGIGNYTDANDVRGPHARSNVVDESVNLIINQLDVPYKVTFADSVGEKNGNGGRTLARIKVPSSFNGQVILGLNYQGNPNSFDGKIKHSPGQDIVIVNKFFDNSLGPLAIFLEENGKIVSDVVGGIGLYHGSHMSWDITFERIS